MRNKLKSIFGAIFIMVASCNYLYATDTALKWDATIGDVSGYIIYYGLSEGNYSYSMDVGNVTQYTLSNLSLSEGMTYYFIVRAYNSVGESGDSNITKYTVPSSGDTTPPIPPEGISGTVVNDSILLKWQANSETDFSEYRVNYGTATRSYDLPISVFGTEYSLTDLETNVTYYISVSAVDTSGNESGYSSPELAVRYIIPDTTTPIVDITSPTTGTSYETESDSISLIGTATDDIRTSSVTWSNSKGGAGIASGTSSWSVSGIALAGGDNVITVIAKDASGNTSTDVLTVTYAIPVVLDTQPPKVILTRPDISKSNVVKKNYVNLAGTASDNIGVEEIRWENAQGGTSGTAKGTNRWNVFKLPLVKGWNDITITAEDSAGNTTVEKFDFDAVFK